jgi:hypothetical protein
MSPGIIFCTRHLPMLRLRFGVYVAACSGKKASIRINLF